MTVGDLDRQRASDDVEAIAALPAQWAGKDPIGIVESVLELLLDRLDLDFAAFRFRDGAPGFVRLGATAAAHAPPTDVLKTLEPWLLDEDGAESDLIEFGGAAFRLLCRPMGNISSLGNFVLGATRHEFPSRSDTLKLDLAARQAGLACREIRELAEARRPEDLRVEKLTGEALAESESRLNLIINSIPAMAWSATPDGFLDFANQYFRDFIFGGYDSVEGANFYQIFHPDDMPTLLSTWQEVMSTKQPREIDGRLRRADGEYVWCTLRQKPLLGADGEVLKWFGVVLVIEDRKRAELALQASEAALSASESNLSLILNSLPVLVWSARPDGSADFVNKLWADYAGKPAEEILGWGFLDTYHPDDMPKMLEIWRRDLETGEETLIKGRIRGADGSWRWFLFKGSKLRDATGVVRWFGANIDIHDLQVAESALRASEAALQESERRLQQIISSIPGLAWSSDSEGRTTYWSQQYLDYAGLEFEAVVGFGFLDHIHPEDLPHVQEVWAATLASGSPGEAEARLRRADGQYRWFLIRASPFYDGAGRLTQWFGVNVDIENRKRAEEELSRSRSDLAHVTRMMTMDELAVSIAHEVNQPLMAIVTNASACLRWLCADEPDIGAARETMERIVSDGHRAGDIVTSIRGLARKTPARLERLGLNPVVQAVLAMLKGELQRRGVAVRTELAVPDVEVTGDKTQLQQVVLNLIMNALEAMTDVESGQRRLTVRTAPGKQGARLEVSDTGTGLDAAATDRIFEPFFSTKAEGVGMGLAICRSIVETHGGTITAAGHPLRGSVFKVKLPFAGAPFDNV